MAENVCCPTCWSWAELGRRTTCQRCGAPLLLPDGRTIAAVRSGPPPPPEPPAAFANPPGLVAATPAGFAAPVFGGQPAERNTDWVSVCRLMTIAYGALAALVLIGVGLLVQHINVPITDPSTGITTIQTFNIGPAFAIAAVILAGLCALFAWLTQYPAARVIFLLIDVLALLNAIVGIGGTGRAGAAGILGLVSLIFDAVYGWALVMSLLPRPQPAYS